MSKGRAGRLFLTRTPAEPPILNSADEMRGFRQPADFLSSRS
jgi:hypothetical protein